MFLMNIEINNITLIKWILTFHDFDCRAWRLQGWPRTRLRSQRQQEPRSNLLNRTVHISQWTASHQELFRTETDYLSPSIQFFLTGLHFLFTFQLAHKNFFFFFLEGGLGVCFPVSRTSDNRLRVFSTCHFSIYSLYSSWPRWWFINLNVWFVFSLNFWIVYFCGTKDCQVVTDKYFCQIVVEKDKCPLVLRHGNEYTSTLLFNPFFFY